MREYPAYGRTLASHVVRGQKPMTIAVLLSSYWGYFDHVPKVCIRPDDWTLGRYELSFLRGLHVVAVPGDECTEAQLAELLFDLMRAGPAVLWAIEVEGKVLYGGDSPNELAAWLREMVIRNRGATRLSMASIRAAEAIMAAAHRRANELWQREYERIRQRGDLEASTRYALREYEIKDRVRELFVPGR